MNHPHVTTLVSGVATLVLAGCPAETNPATPDSGSPGTDASSPLDMGEGPLIDSGSSRDAGAEVEPDTGSTSPDAGSTPIDMGAPDPPDMSTPSDAGSCPWPEVASPTDSPLDARAARHESTRADGFGDEYLYNPSGTLKVGVRREWGGSIVFFGQSGNSPGFNPTNTIDANDTGREVQVALYDPERRMQECAWDASCLSSPTSCPNSITYLGWNPVQGGNRCNNGSPTETFSTTPSRMSLTTIPLQWNPNWEANTCVSDGCSQPALASLPSDVRLYQHLSWVDDDVLELRYTVENLTGVDHASTVQEMPTLYTANGEQGPDLWRLFASDGTEISIDQPANDGFFSKNFSSPEPWVTLQNDALDYGVGILYENGILDFQGWQNRNLPFNNVRARFAFGLPGNSAVHARAYLFVGSQATITARARALLGDLPAFGVLDTPAPNTPASGTVQVSGWALDNRGVQSVYALVDETQRFDLTTGRPRADVCLAWPGYADCPNPGFAGSIELPASECPHKVEIVAVDSDGNSRTIARRLIASP